MNIEISLQKIVGICWESFSHSLSLCLMNDVDLDFYIYIHRWNWIWPASKFFCNESQRIIRILKTFQVIIIVKNEYYMELLYNCMVKYPENSWICYTILVVHVYFNANNSSEPWTLFPFTSHPNECQCQSPLIRRKIQT